MNNNTHQVAIKKLADKDKKIKNAIIKYGMPNDRITKGGFETLFKMIVGQQISVKAANSVWEKLKKINANDFKNLLLVSDLKLREAGLSRQKISYSRDLAQKIKNESLVLENLAKLSSEEAHKKLTQVKGIGDWTADVYQLFVLGHMDAFPQADLAVQEGAKRYFQLATRPSANELVRLAEKWRPFRGAGALVMWQIYRVEVREGSTVN
tara:strand:- start:79 stop:705 length:627 start_codon:yes stop_codon:yes gene_type:complete